MAVGVVTGSAIFVAPLAFGLGLFAGRSELRTSWALGLYTALVIAFFFGLGYWYGDDDWWFYAIYGTSALLAVLTLFKVGTLVRRRFSRRPE